MLQNFAGSTAFFEYLRQPVDPADFSDELSFSEGHGQHLLPYESTHYPSLLKQVFDPPPLLYVLGQPQVLHEPQLAIVGSRNASSRGCRRSHGFAGELANLGITITSGLALGIDQAAHEGTLSRDGSTIAVLGNGLNTIYPRQNKGLAEAIIERGGAIVSEQPLSAGPLAANFPKRNRIISGLSLGTLVIEATVKSGSLITARMAAEQGRSVFAIPGDLDNPHSKGCHRLIRDGAQLTETIDDILAEISPQLKPYLAAENSTVSTVETSPQEAKVLESIGYASSTIDEIIIDTQLTAAEVSSILLSLELSDQITGQPGGRYSRS